MVSSIVSTLSHRRTPEFTSPDDERILQHISILEVLNECSEWLIRVQTVFPQTLVQITVLIPGFMEQLHKAHVSLEQSTSQKAISGEAGLFDILYIVGIESRLRFLRKIH